MKSKWPKIIYKEEGMREGMQIESANIPVDSKIELLDSLSETGLKWIVVGSFVSPRYTPQMACIDEIVKNFRPKPGVKYTALALNEKGIERALEYVPPLTLDIDMFPRLQCHMCDVFTRRNANRSQFQEIETWASVIESAVTNNITEVGIGLHAAWGSNFLGEFPVDWTMAVLERQHALWEKAERSVVSVALGDPMSWCMPHKVEETLIQIKTRWPDISHFRLHFHNARNMALASIYAALTVLSPEDTLELDGTIGGFGGCPYCGNGQMTGQAPTEDLLHMLEDMGIDTGVNIDRLIESVWLCEKIVGHELYGHVSKAGPRPKSFSQLYDINMPFIETRHHASHFKLGQEVYNDSIYPWKTAIASAYYDRLNSGLPVYEVDGDWPWKQAGLLG